MFKSYQVHLESHLVSHFVPGSKAKRPVIQSRTVGIAEHIDIQDQSLLEVQSPSVNTHHLELQIKCIRGTIAHIWDDYSVVLFKLY